MVWAIWVIANRRRHKRPTLGTHSGADIAYLPHQVTCCILQISRLGHLERILGKHLVEGLEVGQRIDADEVIAGPVTIASVRLH